MLLRFSTLALGVAIWFAPGLRADTITFRDLTDSLTVDHTGENDTLNGSCVSEVCSIAVTITEDPVVSTRNFNIFEDAQFTKLSDTLQIAVTDENHYTLTFRSDGDPGTPLTALSNGHNIQENGSIQTLDIEFPDTIRFESDVDRTTVPEPAVSSLVGAALAGLFFIARRKRFAS